MATQALSLQRFNPFARPPSGPTGMTVRRGPSPALARANQALDATKAKLTMARKNTAGKGGAVEAAIATIAGGAVAGGLKAKMPLLPVVNLDSRIGAAAGLIGAGMFLVKGRIGGWLVNAGAGVGATIVSDAVEDALDGKE